MQSKVSSTTKNTTRISENMSAPVAIGTRGTVGSLVRREIEYFSRFETSFRKAAQSQGQQMIVDMGSSSRSTGHSRHGFWFMIMCWKRKKRRGGSSSSSSGFLPSICSASEVSADKDRLNGIPGFNYRILKSDVNKLHI
ncbi:hypothetical protein Dsin_027900 [Dipteronia sinensis]|uniref:Uncharacterized protein n=1 Tax=Dipteronia sinensis TaxID=43782 RepID=A0AAD9ZQ36_9ROSI|nr:hypothetical protein Dsin_027900 [Dipteronia sinensis]